MRFKRDFSCGAVDLEMTEPGDGGPLCRPFDLADQRTGRGAPEHKMTIYWESQYVHLRGPRELFVELARSILEAFRVPPQPMRIEVVVTQPPAAPPAPVAPDDPERAEVEAIKKGLRR